jgi:hypothetical protein
MKLAVPAPAGFYGCPTCRQIKPTSEFHRSSESSRGHASQCKLCKIAKNKAAPLSTTVRERFEKRVIRADGCWLWDGSHSKTGRPTLYVGGRKFMELAYRVAWELAGREAPTWPMVLDHRCRNPKCVNPDHLRIVTQRDNTTIYARRKTKVRYQEIHENFPPVNDA